MMVYMATMLILFGNFYVSSYLKPKRSDGKAATKTD